MKKIIQTLVELLEILLHCPLLLLFATSSQKEIILADLTRWLHLLTWPNRPPLINLLLLFARAPEFRNLYYFRIAKGNTVARLLMGGLQLIYRQFPTLFIDRSCNIGPGLFIQHGFSTIIMADLGQNCWINQQVTIGHKDKTGRPKIGDNVQITAGAKVIGNITIGNNVTIGANAVVVKDVPDNCVMVGIPAYILKQNDVRVS
jgi:serine O-acetyltransferase